MYDGTCPHKEMIMKLVEHPEVIESLRQPTEEDPWRILFSGCLMGQMCGVDGTDYGMGTGGPAWWSSPLVSAVGFCPEAFELGIPRTTPDIHGGDGFDALDGKARILDEHGDDLTEPMIAGAEAMLKKATKHRVELAILTDMSAACGSQVISEGCRFDEERKYQQGVGVAAALLIRHDIPVVSQRDDRTLDRLRLKVEPESSPDPDAMDHHETRWVQEYFGD